LVDPDYSELSVQHQCQLLKVNRSSYYYQPKPVSEEELILLRLLDEQYLKTPFYGSRKFTVFLRSLGYQVNRKRVIRILRQLGLQAIYPKRRTTLVNPEHRVYPYLLRGLSIDRANQVWCTDITYLPIGKGHFYLVAIMDWFSRRVLAWRISNTMDVHFCKCALEEALLNHGRPEIFNSDQGSQFTSKEFTGCLQEANIEISMDGRGRCFDNIFIERLWRSIKYELIYIQDFEDGKHLTEEVKKWLTWYNEERPHQALGYQTPDQVYRQSLKLAKKLATESGDRVRA
jgi:putative transposase